MNSLGLASLSIFSGLCAVEMGSTCLVPVPGISPALGGANVGQVCELDKEGGGGYRLSTVSLHMKGTLPHKLSTILRDELALEGQCLPTSARSPRYETS